MFSLHNAYLWGGLQIEELFKSQQFLCFRSLANLSKLVNNPNSILNNSRWRINFMTEGCLCRYDQFTCSNTGCGSQTFQEIRTENVPDGHLHPMKKP